jgi:hypothetical protein
MLNVWKHDHLCENLTFIGYLYEICSMCENMTICVKIWLSFYIRVKIWLFLNCVQLLKVLCLVSDGHYTESSNCSISNEEKGRHALGTRISHLIKWRCASPFYFIGKKKNTCILFSTEFSLHQHAAWPLAHIRTRMCANDHSSGPVQEAMHEAQVVWYLRST